MSFGDGANGARGWGRSNLRSNGFTKSFNSKPTSLNTNPSTYKVLGARNGQNLTAQAYPSSTAGFTPTVTQTTTPGGGGAGGGNSKALASLLAAYGQTNPYGDYYNQRNAMAKQAYENSMGALDAAYGAYMQAIEDSFGSTKGQLQDSYNRSKKNIVDDAIHSLKQAYVNKMLSQKNFDQQMSAQGITGGASETSRVSMENNYGNARNDINRTKARNLSDLEGEYNDNLASALQAYNQAVAQAQLAKAEQVMQLENALANNQIAALDDYYSLVKDSEGSMNNAFMAAIQNGQNFSFDPTQVNNTFTPTEILQANTMDQRSFANLLQALQAIMAQNGNKNIPINQLLAQLGA